jgi:ABC-2 type transport system ATP-binding protein
MKAVEVEGLTHRYGDRLALDNVRFSVEEGHIFGLVGPNGGGKSTTFRVLSTLTVPTSGSVRIFGVDILKEPHLVRRKIGVVFQSPGLDKKLRVLENLRYQGRLYGMSGPELERRAVEMLERVGLADRAGDTVEKLSGGLKRRLEIARALLHGPKLLILDEPTTGLDPLARREIWDHLKHLRTSEGLTVLATTHLLDEAETCNDVAFLDGGKLVLAGEPRKLRELMGGDIISVRSKSPDTLKGAIEKKYSVRAQLVDGEIRIERRAGHELIADLVTSFRDQIDAVTVGKPTLEDLFIERTGRRLWHSASREAATR